MTRTNRPSEAIADHHGRAAGRAVAPGSVAIPQEEQAEGRPDEDAVVPGEHGQPDQGARHSKCARVAFAAPGAQPQGAEDDRLIQREVVRLGHEHRRRRDGDEQARAEGDVASRPGLGRERPGHRCGQ